MIEEDRHNIPTAMVKAAEDIELYTWHGEHSLQFQNVLHFHAD